jgi:ABC-type branched-subunit amino acid transport system ATPase component
MSTAQSTDDPRLDVRADRLQEGASGGRQPPPAETASGSAVEVAHLRKTYGELIAVDDVSFEVAEGEIFGILGPNGAGKTTTVECVIGLRSPDSGTVRLLGLDAQADRGQLHEIVGVQLQASAFPAKLRVGEILDMYRSFYRDPADVGELVGAFGLADKRRDYYRSLSGGQRQRLSVALALIGRPKIAVLDEMTTGTGSAGPPGRLGAHRGHPRARDDDRAGDALHGGSRAAVRPGGADGRRPQMGVVQ